MDVEPADDRRRTFDEVADRYHQARPSYPGALFDRLAQLLPARPQIVEVGPGTGQATESMLERGAKVRAIELGPRLAAQLSDRLEGFVVGGQLDVVVGDFEMVDPEPAFADAVASATAYHWVSSGQQLARPPLWLRPGGRLVVIDTMQVASPLDGGYFDVAQAIYEKYGQASGSPNHDPATVTPPIHRRMADSERCADLTLDRFRWDQTYSAAGYRSLLETYSGTIAMPQPGRGQMVEELVELVEDMGGAVTRPLVITLATCAFAY